MNVGAVLHRDLSQLWIAAQSRSYVATKNRNIEYWTPHIAPI
jgi:hypothetical protein